jgi:hypothetical protein
MIFEKVYYKQNFRPLVQRRRKKTYCGIGRFKIKEIPFREDFPCYFQRGNAASIIIGNFCIVSQKCYV